jgi:hypothetical protein
MWQRQNSLGQKAPRFSDFALWEKGVFKNFMKNMFHKECGVQRGRRK